MTRAPEHRVSCRLTLTINLVHFSVRPIPSEDDKMRAALLFVWPHLDHGPWPGENELTPTAVGVVGSKASWSKSRSRPNWRC